MMTFLVYLFFSIGLSIPLYACTGRSHPKEAVTDVRELEVITDDFKDALNFSITPNTVFYLSKDIDLKGKVYKIPQGVTIKQVNGCFKNGTLVGNKTKIAAKTALFDHVSIQGTWNVPSISTELFKDLDYTNSLQDLIALSDNNVENTIYIKPGNYILSVKNNNQSCLTIRSNTDIKIDGRLILLPNSFTHYNIICAKGDNIHISGKGTIIGDKDKHTGSEGEWGMGVRFLNARHSTIVGLNILDCWGDCVYIGGSSSDVKVKQCILRNGRRQGISITSGKNIMIEKCNIYDIAGTSPMFAIDVEPNKTGVVDSIFIKNVKAYNCVGGIMCTRSTRSDSSIGYVEVTDCTVSGTTKSGCFRFKGAHTICIKRCKGSGKQISFDNVRNVVTEKNVIAGLKQNQMYKFYKCRNIKNK